MQLSPCSILWIPLQLNSTGVTYPMLRYFNDCHLFAAKQYKAHTYIHYLFSYCYNHAWKEEYYLLDMHFLSILLGCLVMWFINSWITVIDWSLRGRVNCGIVKAYFNTNYPARMHAQIGCYFRCSEHKNRHIPRCRHLSNLQAQWINLIRRKTGLSVHQIDGHSPQASQIVPVCGLT